MYFLLLNLSLQLKIDFFIIFNLQYKKLNFYSFLELKKVRMIRSVIIIILRSFQNESGVLL